MVLPHAERVQDRGHAVHVGVFADLDQLFARMHACVAFHLQRRVHEVDFQQVIIIRAADLPVPHQSFQVVRDSGQVETLEHAFHMETVLCQILTQVLRTVTVVSDLQRIDLILFDQIHKPLINIVIIHEVVAGQRKKSPLDHGFIWNLIPVRGFRQLLAGQPEMGKDPQDPVPLDQRAGAGKVRCL